MRMAALREGKVGNLLADGSLRMAREFGHNSEAYAMQVKGLELAAYNCKFIPGQALAFGVAAIGAHHREAWIITFEIKNTTRESYGPEKAAKVIELQRIRGGLFEFIVACRFPWIENGWPLDNYPKYFNTATGLNWGLDDMWNVGRPDLRPDQASLSPGVPERHARGRLSSARLVRPGQRRHGRPDRRQASRNRQIRRASSSTTTT